MYVEDPSLIIARLTAEGGYIMLDMMLSLLI